MGTIQFGYSLVYFSSCIDILTAQLKWTDHQSHLYSAIITCMPSVGQAFGSFGAIKIAGALGHRKSLLLANLIAAIGVGITLIANLYAINVGRFLLGFSMG